MLSKIKILHHLSHDQQAKRELIEACLRPGDSVAKLALTHGVNAKLLRTWMTKHQRQLSGGDSLLPSIATPAPFIPVVMVSAQQSMIAALELTARLPNGVRLNLLAFPADQLAQLLRLLSTPPCFESMPG